ncbi:MAG: S8 family serine peptidase [Acaryochloridaceae cyanobacterium SU_2_1]|nr:S8 family serine peptidase [Acaryochloridaceae cyanobacterium SU_2_1]
MKQFFWSTLCLGTVLAGMALPVSDGNNRVVAQSAVVERVAQTDLYYLYHNQRIPLTERRDAIAVTGKPSTRGENFVSGLRQHLRTSSAQSRGNSPGVTAVEIRALGTSDALVRLPQTAQGNFEQWKTKIQQFNGTSTVLPVLSRGDQQETLVLPNEILVSFEPQLPPAQIQKILNSQNLEIIRPLQFTTNRYLVRSKTATGTAVLGIANQLHQVAGVQSATPNFIPARTTNQVRAFHKQGLPQPTSHYPLSSRKPPSLPKAFRSSLMGLLWHLNSLRVPAAWANRRGGSGVKVAVIDTLIQWDHPNLKQSLVSITGPKRCPGESHGWDVVGDDADPNDACYGDADTRISPAELKTLTTDWQNTFTLSDQDLMAFYPFQAEAISKQVPCDLATTCSIPDLAKGLRAKIRGDISGEFHGTSVAGVVAAQPVNQEGIIGVAPQAKILPIRAAGMGQAGFTSAQMVEAIGYAASRQVDVINMSFGGALPSPDVEAQIQAVLAANPSLILVAAAGNNGSLADDWPQVMFPAAYAQVVAVGAIDPSGQRASYSNFGQGLDVVAPGGDNLGDILTSGGTYLPQFWQGMKTLPSMAPESCFNINCGLLWQRGTSFAAPGVSGVFALMIAEDPGRTLTRDQLISILKNSGSQGQAYPGLVLRPDEQQRYKDAVKNGQISGPISSAMQHFFGHGLVNAEVAVQKVQQSLPK